MAYKGTHFHGWQRQPNGFSVQEAIEKALHILLKQAIETIGCGRTDTGVHAAEYYLHFDVQEPITDTSFLKSLNALCGKDIAIYELIEVTPEAHARFDATERTYYYHVHFVKNPFLEESSNFLSFKPSFDLMNKAAASLLQHRDFGSFCKAGAQSATTLCKVSAAEWICINEQQWYFKITADRFLRNMVRAIVGTLLDVGYRKLKLAEFEQIIQDQNRSSAGMSVPAKGLFLQQIKYPYL